MDLHDISWTGRPGAKEQLIAFWWRSRAEISTIRQLLFLIYNYEFTADRGLIPNPKGMFAGSRNQFNLEMTK